MNPAPTPMIEPNNPANLPNREPNDCAPALATAAPKTAPNGPPTAPPIKPPIPITPIFPDKVCPTEPILSAIVLSALLSKYKAICWDIGSSR